MVWVDLLVFLAIYYSLHLIYEFILDGTSKLWFEKCVIYADDCLKLIPLSFVLGFYVSTVMGRWWSQYQTIPWPTGIAVYVSSTVHGYDEVGRAMRRTIMRYVCLSLTMVFRMLSPVVQKRFPLMTDLVDAGLLHTNELEIIENLEKQYPGLGKNFLPIVWASSIVTKARAQGRIYSDDAVKTLIKELNSFRGKCGGLVASNSVSIPLVYTQVVTIATYLYFLTMVMAHQVLDQDKRSYLKFPYIMIALFIFFMGWLKVAESLLNPFGEDDDDFDLNSMIDRNLTTSYLIVDDMHHEHPEIVKDHYWDGYPSHIPFKSHEKSVPGPIDEKDFINYQGMKNSKGELSAQSKSTDVENAHEMNDTIKPSSTENPIPNAAVIDKRYSKKFDGEMLMRQNELEQNMNRVRRRSIVTVNGKDDSSSRSSAEGETPSRLQSMRKASKSKQ